MQQPDAYVGQNPAEVLARGFLPDFTRLQRQRNVHNMEYITHTDQTLSARTGCFGADPHRDRARVGG